MHIYLVAIPSVHTSAFCNSHLIQMSKSKPLEMSCNSSILQHSLIAEIFKLDFLSQNTHKSLKSFNLILSLTGHSGTYLIPSKTKRQPGFSCGKNKKQLKACKHWRLHHGRTEQCIESYLRNKEQITAFLYSRLALAGHHSLLRRSDEHQVSPLTQMESMALIATGSTSS